MSAIPFWNVPLSAAPGSSMTSLLREIRKVAILAADTSSIKRDREIRFTNCCARVMFCVTLSLTVFMLLTLPALSQQSAQSATQNPLAQLLLRKGILMPSEMKLIDAAATRQQAERMASFLLEKGVLSQADYEQIAAKPQESKSLSIAAPVPAPPQPEALSQKPAALAANLQSVRFSAPTRAQAHPNPTEPAAPSQVEKLPPAATAL
jgi:hypothetical protein